MKLSFVKPTRELRPYIESFWVFESPTGFPATDASVAAPNGCPKLTFPFGNSLVSVANGKATTSQAGNLYFVGNRDSSTLLQSSPRETGCIGIEFCPHGAFPISGIHMGEISNALWKAEDLFGAWAREVREELASLESVGRRVSFLQDQLTLLLRKNQSTALLRKNQRGNPLVEYCVRSLKTTDGRISIRELQKKTGYSRRYLAMLFQQYVGLSPKVLAGIFRFQRFYRKWAEGQSFDRLKSDLYEHYFDQAHFTREFKRMTGYTPLEYNCEVSNEFGRRLRLGRR